MRYPQPTGDVHRLLGSGNELLPFEEAHLGVDDRGVAGPLTFRPFLAESGDRQHDQLRVDRLQVFPAHVETRHDPRAEVLRDDVGFGRQAFHQLLTVRLREVDADGALADVLLGEVAGDSPDAAPDVAGHVALGRFDLEHIRSEIGHDTSGERTGEYPGEVEDLDAFERKRHRPASSLAGAVGQPGTPSSSWTPQEFNTPLTTR